ncbi:chaperone protein LpfB [Klebsiella aerogenes]|nr:chaperone protein LpfB [Klebsiella aerogenes]
MRIFLSFFLSIVTVIFNITNAQAGVVIGGTRLVYPEGKKEINITVENKENFPYLIKTFLEKGSIESSAGYFMITPHFSGLMHNKRVFYVSSTQAVRCRQIENLSFTLT